MLPQFQGKRLVFVTNNSTKSRKQYGKKFETLGLNVCEVSALICFFLSLFTKLCEQEFDGTNELLQEEIFASSFAAAAYLKSINFPKDKKVIMVNLFPWWMLKNESAMLDLIPYACALNLSKRFSHLLFYFQ